MLEIIWKIIIWEISIIILFILSVSILSVFLMIVAGFLQILLNITFLLVNELKGKEVLNYVDFTEMIDFFYDLNFIKLKH